jgi:N-terminal domain of toast_rack, DUF2154
MVRIHIFAVLALLVGAAAFADPVKHEKVSIAAEGAKKIRYDIELGASTFDIRGGVISSALEATVDYDPDYYRFESDFTLKGDVGAVSLESDTRSHRNIDSDDNRWDITISNSMPAELTLEAGACDATIDFGGIPLEELTLDIGAASGEIDFSTPNPVRMRMMSIDAGASSLRMFNLGNANCEEFDFDCGAGSFEFDFRGDYSGETSIRMDIGVSSGDIILPKGVAIQIRGDDDLFSTIDIHNRDLDEVRRGVWESENFDSAKTRIVLDLEVGMGSIDVRWR